MSSAEEEKTSSKNDSGSEFKDPGQMDPKKVCLLNEIVTLCLPTSYSKFSGCHYMNGSR